MKITKWDKQRLRRTELTFTVKIFLFKLRLQLLIGTSELLHAIIAFIVDIKLFNNRGVPQGTAG